VVGSNKCDSGVRDACAAAVLLAVIVHPGCDRCGVHAGQWSVVGISIADTGEETEDPLLIEKTQTPTARRRVCSPSLATLPGHTDQSVSATASVAAAVRTKANTAWDKRRIFDELRSVFGHQTDMPVPLAGAIRIRDHQATGGSVDDAGHASRPAGRHRGPCAPPSSRPGQGCSRTGRRTARRSVRWGRKAARDAAETAAVVTRCRRLPGPVLGHVQPPWCEGGLPRKEAV